MSISRDTSRRVAVGAPLTIDDIDAVARRTAVVELAPATGHRLERSYRFMQQLAQMAVPVYGLTTGCGPLATNAIPTERREQFQRNLVRSHAVTLGTPHAVEFVRAAMSVRAHVLAQGYSGVDPATVEVLVGMLNQGMHPIVREVGAVGASGDLVELAQIALAVIGEGTVEFRATVMPAADALLAAGLAPLVPQYREGLALMNGTSFHTGAAAVLVSRARRLTAAAEVAAAMAVEGLRGNLDAYDPVLQVVRPHPGQRAVAERIASLVRDSALVRDAAAAAANQDAY